MYVLNANVSCFEIRSFVSVSAVPFFPAVVVSKSFSLFIVILQCIKSTVMLISVMFSHHPSCIRLHTN